MEKIAEERIWRVREIATLKSECFDYKSGAEKSRVISRSFIPIAYAHWEGFVKKTAEYYLEFVSRQRLTLNELQPCFLSIYFASRYAKKLAQKNKSSLIEVLKDIEAKQHDKIHINRKNVINTNSNLNSETLYEICFCLGIDIKNYETKEKFIDQILVGRRNHIAHGEYQEIKIDDVKDTAEATLSLIDTFRTDVENAATLKDYMR